MSNVQKNARLPVKIDPFRFVEQGRELTGEIPINGMERLDEYLHQESMYNESAAINVKLRFDRNENRLAVIHTELLGEFDVSCQRCLMAMRYNLNHNVVVALAKTDVQAEESAKKGYEVYLPEDEIMFLKEFIEDEILLALPLILAHESCEHEFIGTSDDVNVGSDNKIEAEVEEKQNPFAVLKDLKS